MAFVQSLLAMDASGSALQVGRDVVEACSALLLEVAFLTALGGFLYTQKKDPTGTPRTHAVRDSRLERITLFFVVVLAFHIEPSLLMYALVGAVAFIVVQQHAAQRAKAKKVGQNKDRSWSPRQKITVVPVASPAHRYQSPSKNGSKPAAMRSIATTSFPARKDSSKQTEELLLSLRSTAADERLAQAVAHMAQKSIAPIVPEAQIDAIALGNLSVQAASWGKAEMELVVTCDPDVLAERLRQYFLACPGPRQVSLQSLSSLPLLTKTATTALSQQLTFVRYWRTQLNSPECKTVHVLPPEVGVFEHPLYVHFSVNTPYPLRMKKILDQESQRCADLILLVRHWARERCVSNVSRGQFSSYTWGTLALYFYRCQLENHTGEKSMMDLFHAFVKFYAGLFQRETAPSIGFANGVQTAPDKTSFPFIEDALEPGHDLSEKTDAEGMERVNEELQRACSMMARSDGNQVATLMAKWIKPAPPTTVWPSP